MRRATSFASALLPAALLLAAMASPAAAGPHGGGGGGGHFAGGGGGGPHGGGAIRASRGWRAGRWRCASAACRGTTRLSRRSSAGMARRVVPARRLLRTWLLPPQPGFHRARRPRRLLRRCLAVLRLRVSLLLPVLVSVPVLRVSDHVSASSRVPGPAVVLPISNTLPTRERRRLPEPARRRLPTSPRARLLRPPDPPTATSSSIASRTMPPSTSTDASGSTRASSTSAGCPSRRACTPSRFACGTARRSIGGSTCLPGRRR